MCGMANSQGGRESPIHIFAEDVDTSCSRELWGRLMRRLASMRVLLRATVRARCSVRQRENVGLE